VKNYDSHKNSHEEYQGVCILQNDAVHFYPTASWGLYVPVKWKGGVRPVLDLADMAGSPPGARNALTWRLKKKPRRPSDMQPEAKA
jgi:hypothetical protein